MGRGQRKRTRSEEEGVAEVGGVVEEEGVEEALEGVLMPIMMILMSNLIVIDDYEIDDRLGPVLTDIKWIDQYYLNLFLYNPS